MKTAVIFIIGLLISIFGIAQSVEKKKAVIVVGKDIENHLFKYDFMSEKTYLESIGWDVYIFKAGYNGPNTNKIYRDSWDLILKYGQNADIFIYRGHGNSYYQTVETTKDAAIDSVVVTSKNKYTLLGNRVKIEKVDTTFYKYITYDPCILSLSDITITGSEFKKLKIKRGGLVIYLNACTAAGSSASDKGSITATEAFKRIKIYSDYFKDQYYVASNGGLKIDTYEIAEVDQRNKSYNNMIVLWTKNIDILKSLKVATTEVRLEKNGITIVKPKDYYIYGFTIRPL